MIIKIATLVCLLLAVSVSAEAARWVIKNPKMMVDLAQMGIEKHSDINLKNHYVVVEVPNSRATAQQIAYAFNADAVFPDIEIRIKNPAEDEPEDEKNQAPDNKGWHVKQLEYAKLNPAYTGQDVIVAVLDTGVDYKHPALISKMWKNTAEIPDNGIDDDGNGLVDDYHGYNFNDNESDPMDLGAHGTHCAGIIAADVHEETGAQGIAQDVKIMPLIVISAYDWGFLSGAAKAVKYAVDNGAQVLSNSWRVYDSWSSFINPEGLELLREAIAYAQEREVIFVAAAGNEAYDLNETNEKDPIYPLSMKDLPYMVGVASSAPNYNGDGALIDDVLSPFSNTGTQTISVAAPGSYIYSTIPRGLWTSMSGTSMATPLVAGAMARGFSKGYSAQEVIDNLKSTTKNSGYWSKYISSGRIDVKGYLE